MIPYFVFDQFSVGGFKMYTWGLLAGLAFSAGYLLTFFEAKKKGFEQDKIIWLAILMFLGAALGGRLFFLLQTPLRFVQEPNLLLDFGGGSMFYGGLLGTLYLAWLYSKKAGWSFWKLLDLLTPAIALGIGIGRIGCALINDHAGAATSLPWGILWHDGVVRHPVGIYESLAGFLLLVIFWWIKRNFLFFKGGLGKIFKNSGNLFLAFLASYAGVRFFLDFTRESQGILADPHWFYLSTSQWISILIFIVSFSFVAAKESHSPASA